MGSPPSDVEPEDTRLETERQMDRLEEAYVRYAPGGTRLAYFLTGDREQARDLVQEAFVRIAGRFRHLRDVNDFEAYLTRTVANLYASGLRRRRLERTWLERERQRRPEDAPPHDPAERDAIWLALQRLPERQRTAVVLRFYEDLSERQVASILGVSPGAVNALVVRAVRALRDDVTRGDDG